MAFVAYLFGVQVLERVANAWVCVFSWQFRGLEVKRCFVSHIEEQVDDAEIGQKAVARGEHLIVGSGCERGVK